MPVFHNQPLRTAVLTVAAAALAAAITAQTVSSQIRVSSIGFLPDMPKKATIADGAANAAFNVIDAASGESVYGGTLPSGRAGWNTDTRDSTRIADFSEFKTSGEYYLQVAGVGRGPNFKIADDVFNDPYRAMMLGMYLWRCGMPNGVSAEYNGKTYSHGACVTAATQTPVI